MNDHLIIQAARELQIEITDSATTVKFKDRHGNPTEVTIDQADDFTTIHAKLKEAKRGK